MGTRRNASEEMAAHRWLGWVWIGLGVVWPFVVMAFMVIGHRGDATLALYGFVILALGTPLVVWAIGVAAVGWGVLRQSKVALHVAALQGLIHVVIAAVMAHEWLDVPQLAWTVIVAMVGISGWPVGAVATEWLTAAARRDRIMDAASLRQLRIVVIAVACAVSIGVPTVVRVMVSQSPRSPW